HSTGFGLTTSPDKMRAETMGALQTGLAALTSKAPDDVDAYRQLVIGTAQAVAEAKGGGVAPVEATMLEEIRKAVDGGAPASPPPDEIRSAGRPRSVGRPPRHPLSNRIGGKRHCRGSTA